MDKFDQLLKDNPVITTPKHGLASDTMNILVRIKRIIFYRRLISGICVLAAALFILKWISNDVFYLLQLIIYKFTVVSIQGNLYLQALLESLPKPQLLALLVSGLIWIVWRRFETLFANIRINNMTILKITPRLLVFSTILVTLALGVSGYTYAQKIEQKKLELLREHINQSGRKEFNTNLEAQECGIANQNLTNQYEIKKDANVSSKAAKNIIRAYCNNSAAEKFLDNIFPMNDTALHSNSHTIVFHVISVDDNELTVQEPSVSYNPSPGYQHFTFSNETYIYNDGKLATSKKIKSGDIVMLSVSRTYASEQGGDPVDTKVLGVYILPPTPDFKWYDLSLQHSVTQIQTCTGNPQDRCSFTGSIDLFPIGGGEGNVRNPAFVDKPTHVEKEIAGSLSEISDKAVKIKTSSGRTFTINFGSNPVEEFNRERSKYYENKTIKKGDTIIVRYFEPEDQNSTVIAGNQIFNAVLMLEIINKTDPIKKY